MFQHNITHVMHFAGLKAVGESCTEPLRYYSNNLISTLTLLKVRFNFFQTIVDALDSPLGYCNT